MLQSIAYEKRFGHSLWLLLGGRKKLEQDLRRAAAHGNDTTIIMTLIDLGANVNAPDPETGRTPLILAVDYDCRSNIKALLAYGADIHIKADNGRSALDMALMRGQEEISDLLADIHRVKRNNHAH